MIYSRRYLYSPVLRGPASHSNVMLFLLFLILFSAIIIRPVPGAGHYLSSVKVGDWWSYGDFVGRCQNPCTPDLQAALDLTEVTAIVVGHTNATSVIVRNTVAFNNGTSRVFATIEDLTTGIGNYSFAFSIVIAGGLTPGDPIFAAAGAPTITGSMVTSIAGADRTVNVLNDTVNGRVFAWDKNTGVLVQFELSQASGHLSYRLTGTSLWAFHARVYDGSCDPAGPVTCGFDPLQITVIAGTTVTWNNTGSLGHGVDTCTMNNNPPPSPLACSFLDPSNQPSFASGMILPRSSWSFTFATPGMYYYYDPFYPFMKGTVTVFGNATAQPDFSISIGSNPLVIPAGSMRWTNVGVSASNGYTGPVTLDGTISVPNGGLRNEGPGSSTFYFYGGSGGGGSTLTIFSQGTTPVGLYRMTITATGNNLIRTKILVINVTAPVTSFYLSTNAESVTIAQGDTVSVPVMVHSLVGFTGQVQLIYYPGIVYGGINPSTIMLQPDQTVTAILSITASYPQNFTAYVTGDYASGTLQSRIRIAVYVVPLVAKLGYLLSYTGSPSDNSVTFHSIFGNFGNVDERVTGIRLRIDFGNFTYSDGIPLIIQPGMNKTLNLIVMTPTNVSPGYHQVTASVSWEAYHQNNWWPASEDLIVQGSFLVFPRTTSTPPAGGSTTSSTTSSTSSSMQVRVAGIVNSFLGYSAKSFVYEPILVIIMMIYVPFSAGIVLLWARHEREAQRRLRF